MGWYTGKVREPLLEGEKVTILGQEFIVAPANIQRMRRMAAARRIMRDVNDGKLLRDSDEAIRALSEIAAVSLSANYPDITPRTLDELEGIRPDDLVPILVAAAKANGFEQDQGEAKAPATTGAASEGAIAPTIGTTSSSTSSLP